MDLMDISPAKKSKPTKRTYEELQDRLAKAKEVGQLKDIAREQEGKYAEDEILQLIEDKLVKGLEYGKPYSYSCKNVEVELNEDEYTKIINTGTIDNMKYWLEPRLKEWFKDVFSSYCISNDYGTYYQIWFDPSKIKN